MKLIFSDIDGTLIDYKKDKIINKKNIDAVNQIRLSGNQICLSSALPYYYVKEMLDKNNLVIDYVASSGGSKIYDVNGSCIYEYKGYQYEWNLLMNRVDKANLAYGNINRAHLFFKDQISADNASWKNKFVENYSSEIFIDDNKKIWNEILSDRTHVGIYGDERSIVEINKFISDNLSTIKPFVDKKMGIVINISNVGKGKLEALKFLKDLNRIDEEDLYVIGDGYNDLEALKYVKNSFTYHDTYPEIVEACNNIIKNDDDRPSFFKILNFI